jgi:hypothetical protein
MAIKTRHPYRLTDADFDTFNYVDMKIFLVGPNSLPHRPDHLVPQQAALADAFHLKLDEYLASCGVRSNATSAFGEASKTIREKLRWIKMALPSLTPGSDEILVPFGLDADIPADNDKMKNFADAVNAHWQSVRTEAIYTPFMANIDALAALFPSYVTAQANQNVAQQAAALLQNEKEDLRNQLEDVLAALIDWYRIYYKESQDEYWTQTPWGKSSGEEPGPSGPEWPNVPVGKITKATVPLNGLLAGCEPYTGADRFDIRITWAKKNQPVPAMPLVDSYTDVMQPVYLDEQNFPLEKGYVYYLWIRARKNNEISEWSEVVGMLWE